MINSLAVLGAANECAASAIEVAIRNLIILKRDDAMEKLESALMAKLANENVLLALVPVLATFFSLIFQMSYFSYFGVPPSFIELDINKIVFSVAAIVLASYLYGVLLAFAYSLSGNSKFLLVRFLGRFLVPIFMFSPLMLMSISVGSYFPVVFFVVLSCIAAWAPKKVDDNELRRVGSGGLFNGLGSVFFYGSIYVFLLGYFWASVLGSSNYLKDNRDALFVAKVGDSYVFTMVDPETNEFGKELLVLSSSEKIELVTQDRVVKSSHRFSGK